MWHDSKHTACVCIKSLKVHLCGKDCAIPSTLLPHGEGYVCPLTNIVMPHPVLVATPMFDKNGKCCNHWSTYGKVVRSRAPRKLARKMFKEHDCSRIVYDMLVGKTRAAILRIQRARACKKIAKQGRLSGSFVSMRKAIHTQMAALPRPLPRDAPSYVTKIAASIAAYANKHHVCRLGTIDITIATFLTMLSTGVNTNGITVVPYSSFVAANIPPPTLMAHAPGVHCRSISVAIRKFKKFALGVHGIPVVSRAFVL